MHIRRIWTGFVLLVFITNNWSELSAIPINEDIEIIPASANLGVGTDSPLAKLDVNGQVLIRGGSPQENFVLTSDSQGLATWQDPSSLINNTNTLTDITVNNSNESGLVKLTQEGGGDSAIQFTRGVIPILGQAWSIGMDGSDDNAFKFSFGSVESSSRLGNQDRFVIDSDGNIRIGESTDTTANLDISHHSNPTINLKHILSNVLPDQSFGTIVFSASDGGSDAAPQHGARIEAGLSNISWSAGSSPTNLLFKTSSFGTNIPDTKMFIEHTGNTGIGTEEPNAKLDVIGDIRIGDSTTICNNSAAEGIQRYNKTEKRMEFCDGSNWRSFGSSGKPPGFLVHLNNVDEDITIDTLPNWRAEEYDNTDEFNLSIDRFSTSTPGKYLVTMFVNTANLKYVGCRIKKNNVAVMENPGYDGSGTEFRGAVCITVVEMNSLADYLQGEFMATGNGTIRVNGDKRRTFFMAQRISD